MLSRSCTRFIPFIHALRSHGVLPHGKMQARPIISAHSLAHISSDQLMSLHFPHALHCHSVIHRQTVLPCLGFCCRLSICHKMIGQSCEFLKNLEFSNKNSKPNFTISQCYGRNRCRKKHRKAIVSFRNLRYFEHFHSSLNVLHIKMEKPWATAGARLQQIFGPSDMHILQTTTPLSSLIPLDLMIHLSRTQKF